MANNHPGHLLENFEPPVSLATHNAAALHHCVPPSCQDLDNASIEAFPIVNPSIDMYSLSGSIDNRSQRTNDIPLIVEVEKILAVKHEDEQHSVAKVSAFEFPDSTMIAQRRDEVSTACWHRTGSEEAAFLANSRLIPNVAPNEPCAQHRADRHTQIPRCPNDLNEKFQQLPKELSTTKDEITSDSLELQLIEASVNSSRYENQRSYDELEHEKQFCGQGLPRFQTENSASRLSQVDMEHHHRATVNRLTLDLQRRQTVYNSLIQSRAEIEQFHLATMASLDHDFRTVIETATRHHKDLQAQIQYHAAQYAYLKANLQIPEASKEFFETLKCLRAETEALNRCKVELKTHFVACFEAYRTIHGIGASLDDV